MACAGACWRSLPRALRSKTSSTLASLNSYRCSSGVSYPLNLASVSENHAAWYEESLRNPERFWGHLAGTRLRWMKEFDRVMDCDMTEGTAEWFGGGKLNVSGKRKVFSR